MATNHPVLKEIVLRPGFDTPAKLAEIIIRLVGTDGQRISGYVPDEDITIDGVYRPDVDPETGLWSHALWPNDKIIPSGAVWERTLRNDGVTTRVPIILPDDNAEHWLDDVVTDYPGSLDPTGLALERARALAAEEELGADIEELADEVSDVIVAIVEIDAALDSELLTRAYHHDQGVPAAVWTITHDLGYRPAGIYVQDSGGSQNEPSVNHLSVNTVELTFLGAMGGTADLS